MRIAQVCLRFDAPGGVETTVRELSRRLVAEGDEVTVYTTDLYDEGRWERRTGFRPVVDGVPVERFPVYRRLVPGLTMPLPVGLVRALAQDRPDVLHAHSHRYGHVLEAAAVARATGIPLVVSTHYHPAHPGEPIGKRALLKVQDLVFGAGAYRTAGAILVETEHEAAVVAGFAPRDRIRVIPPGIDLSEWADPTSPPLPGGLPSKYLLYAGRIASNKGLPVLVRALARIPAAERIPLVLLGQDWGARAEVERVARSTGVPEALHFLGHLEDRAVYRAVFRRASAFVLPSEYEAFGLVLLEAMAADLPTIATAVGGVPDVLDRGRAGRLVPPGDPVALADALREVTGNHDLAERLRAAGRARVRSFSWDGAVRAHRSIYAALAGP